MHCIHCFNCMFSTFLCAKLCAQLYIMSWRWLHRVWGKAAPQFCDWTSPYYIWEYKPQCLQVNVTLGSLEGNPNRRSWVMNPWMSARKITATLQWNSITKTRVNLPCRTTDFKSELGVLTSFNYALPSFITDVSAASKQATCGLVSLRCPHLCGSSRNYSLNFFRSSNRLSQPIIWQMKATLTHRPKDQRCRCSQVRSNSPLASRDC